MEEQAGSSPLFAVFVLSVYSLFLIPYTIYKLCVAAAPDEVVKPWESVSYSPQSTCLLLSESQPASLFRYILYCLLIF